MTEHQILVVEDDVDIRESLVEYLEDHGYSAIGAQDGQAALDRLETNAPKPCLIVLDLMMPVMDGRTFRETQLKDPKIAEIPVLVISAYRDLAEIAKDLAPVGYLKKPLQLNALLEVVARYCPA